MYIDSGFKDRAQFKRGSEVTEKLGYDRPTSDKEHQFANLSTLNHRWHNLTSPPLQNFLGTDVWYNSLQKMREW